MFILEYKNGVKPKELSPKTKANMECPELFLKKLVIKLLTSALLPYIIYL